MARSCVLLVMLVIVRVVGLLVVIVLVVGQVSGAVTQGGQVLCVQVRASFFSSDASDFYYQ